MVASRRVSFPSAVLAIGDLSSGSGCYSLPAGCTSRGVMWVAGSDSRTDPVQSSSARPLPTNVEAITLRRWSSNFASVLSTAGFIDCSSARVYSTRHFSRASPGFVSKLWLTRDENEVYRGIYQWDGAVRAASYAEALQSILTLVSMPGSIAYHVVPGETRSEFLAVSEGLTSAVASTASDSWWRVS